MIAKRFKRFVSLRLPALIRANRRQLPDGRHNRNLARADLVSVLPVICSQSAATRRRSPILFSVTRQSLITCATMRSSGRSPALDVQPLDSAAWNLCGLQVHASAVSAGPSWRSLLPNRDHRLDRSLTGGPRVSVGATGRHQVAPANLAGARGAGNILGTLDRVSANWRNASEPAHSSHPGRWRRGFARLGVLRRAYGDNARYSSPGKSVCVAASGTTRRRRAWRSACAVACLSCPAFDYRYGPHGSHCLACVGGADSRRAGNRALASVDDAMEVLCNSDSTPENANRAVA